MSFAPYLAAAGTAIQGIQKAQASQYNAAVMTQEQRNTVDQAAAQEGQVRRNSREMLGRQMAAFGSANVGYGGSSEVALDQSAVNQELDALNTRYKGAITGWGYGAQAQLDRSMAKQQNLTTGLMAGAALLKGLGPNYTFSATPSSGLGG